MVLESQRGKVNMSLLKHFAYGSNLHPLRFKERVPSSKLLGVTELQGWSLRFHKKSRDGSGKCNIIKTGKETDRVFGAIYEFLKNDRSSLDRYEGLGSGYNEIALELPDHGNTFLYIADPKYIDDSLSPFTWYKNFVLAGARYHNFPDEYVASIKGFQAIEDPDASRTFKNIRVLQEINDL